MRRQLRDRTCATINNRKEGLSRCECLRHNHEVAIITEGVVSGANVTPGKKNK